MPTLDGLDTSHYQQFTSVPLPQLTFACHKASEGRSWKDPTFQSAIQTYRRSGNVKLIGAYHFTLPDVPAGDQFANFRAQCESVGGVDFIMQDVERDEHTGRCPQEGIAWEFEQRCMDWNPRYLRYSAAWVDGFQVWYKRPGRGALWFANYGSVGPAVANSLGAVVLQYTSTQAVPGVVTNGINRVDCNTITHWPAWDAMFGNKPVVQNPEPTAPTPGGDDDMAKYVLLTAPDRPETLVSFDGSGVGAIPWDGQNQDDWAHTLIAFGPGDGTSYPSRVSCAASYYDWLVGKANVRRTTPVAGVGPTADGPYELIGTIKRAN